VLLQITLRFGDSRVWAAEAAVGIGYFTTPTRLRLIVSATAMMITRP
jgi:hypothetical protein